MKIAWFTPFNVKSAIGRYSKFAAQALSKYADVDLFISEQEDLHTTSLHTVLYNQKNVISLLENYDICIYNMGDNLDYHGSIYDVIQKRPGIVISHDLCLHNFFNRYYFIRQKQPEKYIKISTRIYGEKDADMIQNASMSIEKWANMNLNDYHMTEQLYPYSLGLVVHSEYHASKLKLSYGGPICIVPLLYNNEWDIDKIKNNNFNGYDSSKINLLTVGNVNPNKRAPSIIKAIGSNNELSGKINWTCIGSLDYKDYLEQLRKQITEMHLDKNIKLLGFVEHDQLCNYYAHADAVVNLRYPALEGASASLVEQMQIGKTVIVSNTGVYSEMPDDCVIKIDPYNEEEELTQALLDLVNNPTKLKSYGANAKAYAQNTFSSEKYGEKLFNFIQSVDFLKPLYSLTDLISQELKSIGVFSDMRICETISNEIEYLYAKK